MYTAKEQEEFAQARNYAIMNSDYKFIELRLKNIRMKNVAGIEEINAIPYDDPDGMGELFHLNIKGGQAHFSIDKTKGGGWFDYWVDTEHNRKFLASHWDDEPSERYWEIIDKSIEKEVIRRHKNMVQVAVKVPTETAEILTKVKELNQRLISCDEKDAPLIRQQQQDLLARITPDDALLKEVVKVGKEGEKITDVVSIVGERKV